MNGLAVKRWTIMGVILVKFIIIYYVQQPYDILVSDSIKKYQNACKHYFSAPIMSIVSSLRLNNS